MLADCAIATHFEKGQTILRKGEFAKGFYLIESGEVVLESGEESGEPVVVDTISPGDSLGWSWMFPPYVWRFTAISVEPIDAIFFDGTTLREYCEKDHSLGYELLKRTTLVMLRRLQATRDRMLSILQELDTYENEGKDRIHFQAIREMDDIKLIKYLWRMGKRNCHCDCPSATGAAVRWETSISNLFVTYR